MKTLLLTLSALVIALALGGCAKEEGTMESMGKKMDQAAGDAADKAEEMASDAEQAVEDAAEEVKEAVDK